MKNVPLRFDRRQVLTAGAALAVSPVSFSLPGQQDAPVRIGIVGFGIRGRNLLNGSFLKNAGFKVTAICDVDETRRLDGKRRVDEHYGDTLCSVELEHEKLIAREDVDAVVIATPDHWHTHQILDACAAGKDVYCEKPLTFTLRESQLVIEAVRRAGIVFQTGSQQRSEYGHRFVKAAEAVRAGRIGRVLNVNVGVGDSPVACDLPTEELEPGLDWDRWQGPAPSRGYNAILSPRGAHTHYPRWRDYREYAGGGLADMGAHHLDIAQWALGMDASGPVRVIPPSDPTAKRGAALVYANGVRLTHGGPNGATFIGETGLIAVDRGRISSVPDAILEWEPEEEAERLQRNEGHAADWLARIRDRGRPVCDVEVGARSAAICHLLNIAYWHRQELEWNPTTWRFEGNEAANEWLDYQRRDGYSLPKA
ncbi:MAG: putative dehydrogenase [Planctomycetota bacterium]|jgi:predicted dehydrogenase